MFFGWIGWLVLAGIVLLVVLFIIKKRNAAAKRTPDPDGVPEVPGWPIIGCIPALLRKDFFLDVQLFKKLGPIVRAKSPMGVFYIVSEPELAHEIMLKRANEFVNHPKQSETINKVFDLTEMLTVVRDGIWKRRRRMLSPSFHWKSIQPMLEYFSTHTNILVERLLELPDGTRVDMDDWLARMTLDVIGATAFGTDFHALREGSEVSKAAKVITTDFQKSGARFLLFLPYWEKLPIEGLQAPLRAFRRLKEIIAEVTKMRQSLPPEERPHDLLQTMLDAKDEETGQSLTQKEILDSVFLFLLAGQDTTASALTWALYELSQNPEAEAKLVAEIDSILGPDGVPTPENINDFHWAEQCVKETLRMHPSATLTNRDNNEDVEIQGKIYPKESHFLINIWSMHYDPEFWPEPKKFDPSRFDEEHKNSKSLLRAYLPFGAGPRGCIGFRFALAEAKICLILLYQKLRFSYEEKEKAEPMGFAGSKPKNGMPLVVHHRK